MNGSRAGDCHARTSELSEMSDTDADQAPLMQSAVTHCVQRSVDCRIGDRRVCQPSHASHLSPLISHYLTTSLHLRECCSSLYLTHIFCASSTAASQSPHLYILGNIDTSISNSRYCGRTQSNLLIESGLGWQCGDKASQAASRSAAV